MEIRKRDRLLEKIGKTEGIVLQDLLENVKGIAGPGGLKMLRDDAYCYLGQTVDIEITSYSKWVLELVENVLAEVLPALVKIYPVRFAFAVGDVADGTAFLWEGRFANLVVKPKTAGLINSIFDWLLSSLTQSAALTQSRFLGSEFISPISVVFSVDNKKGLSENNFLSKIQTELKTRKVFLPPINIRFVQSSEIRLKDLLNASCVFGKDDFELAFKSALDASDEEVVSVYCSAVNNLAMNMNEVKLHWQAMSPSAKSDIAVGNYLSARGGKIARAAVRDTGHGNSHGGWAQKNKKFFDLVCANDFDQLMIEDATKALGDSKGAGKLNRYTINNVIGLKRGEAFVPAHDVILKVRGLPDFREDVNHRLDLIKEFAVYAHLQASAGRGLDFIPEGGPLLIDFRKVDLPDDIKKSGGLAGLFIEKIQHAEDENVFTTRAIRITDFWSRAACIKRINRDAKRAGIELDKRQINRVIDDIAKQLWTFGFSLDYADVAFVIAPDGSIRRYHLFDFERLSFGELVDEQHVVLDTLVDLKTRLRSEKWEDTLLTVYEAASVQTGYSHDLVMDMLHPVERKRQNLLRRLREFRRLFFLPGTRFGLFLWSKKLAALIALSRIRRS